MSALSALPHQLEDLRAGKIRFLTICVTSQKMEAIDLQSEQRDLNLFPAIYELYDKSRCFSEFLLSHKEICSVKRRNAVSIYSIQNSERNGHEYNKFPREKQYLFLY